MIRNTCRAIGCAVSLVALCISSGFALDAAPPNLLVPTTTLSLPDDAIGTQGAVVQVPISATPADGIFGIDMTVTYNPAVLTAQDVTVAGIAASAGFVVIKNLNTPGTIVISMYGPQNALSGSGEIAHIQFLVVGNVGNTSPLAFTNAVINEGHIPSAIDNGVFTVYPVGAILSMPDTAQGGPPSVVQVPISVTPGNGILGIDLTITYDAAVLTAQNVTVSGIGATAGFAIAVNVGTPGVITLTTYATSNPLSGSGEFAKIQFLVIGNVGNTSALTFTSASINEGQIPATLDHGLFTVTCLGATDGTACNDGDNVCTPTTDTCQGGACVGTQIICDDSNPCTADSCLPNVGCSSTPGNAGAVCRAASGQCDAAETCTGSSGTCPVDVFASAATTCTGLSQGGLCDGTDHCSGSANTCVDVFAPNTVTCRGSAGQCDVAETCTGSSGTCPVDVFASTATTCTGLSQGGLCDGTDHCSGSANTCVDVFAPNTVTCRGSAGQCDVAETCTGSSGTCPVDVFASTATTCTGLSQGGLCDGTDHCSGSANTCVDVFAPNTVTCRGSAGQCDVAETCTGSSGTCPVDVFASAATTCTGLSQGGLCDGTDHCSGSANTCVDVFAPNTVTCRGSAGQCDVAETCTGSSGTCPVDVFASAATTCAGLSQGGVCDGTDHCSGTANTCVDVFAPNTVTCRGSAGQCDVAETCTGSSGACPANGFVPNGTSCNDSDPTTCTDVCTAGSCAGTAVAEPLEIDASLTMAKVSGSTNISWTDAPGPFNVYRGSYVAETPWLYDQTCFVHATVASPVGDSQNPPPGTMFFYLVSRVNACRESVIGRDSDGTAIPNNNPCPGAP